MIAAWKRVKRNGGAAGVDDMEILEFLISCACIGRRYAENCSTGPMRPHQFDALKSRNRMARNPLGIPTVLDVSFNKR
ncbi:MAG: hypothetical protein R3F31_25275 [Verrucomicrobiales bacterium]